MGKGDRKSKRGKIWRGTTGKRHQNKVKKAFVAADEAPAAKTKKGKK